MNLKYAPGDHSLKELHDIIFHFTIFQLLFIFMNYGEIAAPGLYGETDQI